MPSGDMVAEELIHLADRAPYDAKRRGRDRVAEIAVSRLGLAANILTGIRQGTGARASVA
jgi:hypothetical protein